MCGIAGVIGSHTDEAEALARDLIGSLSHRGPDGVRVERVGKAVLAHARLSIIDLECGWQPLHAAGSTVIGNGEIYNYLELIEAHGLGDRLSTGSDFEPLLHLYAQEGERAFDRLRGMYAFCLVGADGRIWLVRDRFGIKPLYYARTAAGLAFASEPRPLADLLGEHRVEPEADAELLALNYVVGTRTSFPGVDRLPPGGVMQVGERCDLSSSPAAATQPRAVRTLDEAEALTALDAVLKDSVRVHQRSDVPYGLFLSGGIDSTAIATLMRRLNKGAVTAFTCGFEGPDGASLDSARDERASAERVARALDLDWRETRFGEAEFWRIAPLVAKALDDPTTDYATLPTYRLAEAAKGTLTVVLTGEGGDELFAGYGRYRRALRPKWLGGRPSEPQVDAPFLPDGGRAALARWREAAPPRPDLDALQQAQAVDIATWLPNDLLLKLDRCLMAHGLEGRTPFLDREVAAFASQLPVALKVRGRHGKWILRKWLERHCPAAEPWARKRGFTVPVEAWIAPRARELGPRIAEQRHVRAVCDPDAVRAVFEDERHASKRWPLLFFALWSLIQREGVAPEAALEALLGRV